MLAFDTFGAATEKARFTKERLRVGGGSFYPETAMNPDSELARTYKNLMSFNGGLNNTILNPTIDIESFEKLYGLIYFDLGYQNPSLDVVSLKIEFNYELSNNVTSNYQIYSLVLTEEKISLNVQSGKAFLIT